MVSPEPLVFSRKVQPCATTLVSRTQGWHPERLRFGVGRPDTARYVELSEVGPDKKVTLIGSSIHTDDDPRCIKRNDVDCSILDFYVEQKVSELRML